MDKKLFEKNRGFALIESLLYMALFAIIIGGGMVAAYQIIQGTDANYNHVILQEEANFLFRKVNWALTGASSITTPSSPTPTTNLIITKEIGGTPVQLTFSTNSNNLTLERGSAGANILNSGSTTVDSLSFKQDPAASITTDFTLTTYQNGRPASQIFSFIKYLR